MVSVEDEWVPSESEQMDQLQPGDSLIDRGVDDVLDEGYIAPDRWSVAQGFGIDSVRIEDPERCGEQLRDALSRRGPMLVEAVVDPHEPPMPPKVSVKQATQFAKSLASGTPNASRIALTVASDKVREII